MWLKVPTVEMLAGERRLILHVSPEDGAEARRAGFEAGVEACRQQTDGGRLPAPAPAQAEAAAPVGAHTAVWGKISQRLHSNSSHQLSASSVPDRLS